MHNACSSATGSIRLNEAAAHGGPQFLKAPDSRSEQH